MASGASSLPSPGVLSVNPSSSQLEDSRGRTRLFHGVNFVTKSPPWFHPALLQEDYARDLASWGLNLVRLGVMWSGVEPVEGEYSTDYLHNIRTIVQNLGKHGVSVVLDLHQDVASSKFQSYDGFPTWLVAKLRRPASPHSFPWPLDKVESWFLGYVTLDVCQFYQALYDNEQGAVSSLAKVWGVVARHLGGEENVLGYNLLNEPWAGDVFKDGSLLLPGQAGGRNLAPMYEKVQAAIREEDSESLILWEAVTWSHWGWGDSWAWLNSLAICFFRRFPLLFWLKLLSWLGILHLSPEEIEEGPLEKEGRDQLMSNRVEPVDHLNNKEDQCEKKLGLFKEEGQVERTKEGGTGGSKAHPAFGSGFPTVPGGDQWRHKSVLSWHYYFPPLTYSTRTFPWWQRFLAHRFFGPSVFRGAALEVKKLGGAQILTEWGIARPDSEAPESWGSQECSWVMDRADRHNLSWCYWDTENLGVLWQEGSSVPAAVHMLSRPYPLATAGKDLSFSFNPKDGNFQMQWTTQGNSDISLIFLPTHLYGEGMEIQGSAELAWCRSANNPQILEVKSSDNQACTQARLKIKKSPP